ncbi:MAG: cardiolipin synthase [Alcaligenaceae bacterium]|nr:cardiolipin synthase [Alcaligenaceae bacterium]
MINWLLTHWQNILFVIWSVYLVVLVGTILLQKRNPISSLAWILSLALIPVAGLFIYHFFGPRKIEKQKMSRAQKRLFVHRQQEIWKNKIEPTKLKDRHLPIISLIRQITNMPPTYTTAYEIYSGGEETYSAIFKSIEEATEYILLEYYIFAPDQTGTALRDLLIKKLNAGLKVFLLVDSMGSIKLCRSFMKDFEDAGGHLCYFHKIGWGGVSSLINFRNHRKIVICDGVVAFTGGVNITDTQDLRLDPNAYHDVHMRFEGPIVEWFETVFTEDWHYSNRNAEELLLYLKGKSDERLLRQREQVEQLTDNTKIRSLSMQLIPSGPDNELAPILRVMVEAMHMAQHRIYLTTPYFVPDQSALFALTSAALRGVDVKVLVPKKTDTYIVGKAAQSWYEDLIKCGIEVYTYMPRMLHTKTMIVDDDISFIGSTNFDYRSFYLNFELSVISYSKKINQSLSDEFYQTLEQSELFALTPLPLKERLIQASARLLSPIL